MTRRQARGRITGLPLGAGDGFKTERNVAVPPGERTLIDFGIVKAVMTYGGGTRAILKIDPADDPRWSFSLAPVSFGINALGASPLIRLTGSIAADERNAPTLANMDVHFDGGLLEPLQAVFARLQELASFLPGGQNAGLQVSLSEGRLTVRQEFVLPELPLGIGQIRDISLDLGLSIGLLPQSLEFMIGIGRPERPFNWLVSPFAGTGVLMLGARDVETVVLVQAGLGAGLGINLGVASGSAAIVLAFQFDNLLGLWELKVALTGMASLEVLEGLASLSIALTAALGILPELPDKVHVSGEVRVGIHISVCWMVDVDFDGSWNFYQTFDVPQLPGQ